MEAATLHQLWIAVAPAWAEHAEYANARGAEVADRLLALTAPAPGDRVLELASGPGGLGLAAATRVAPGGEVLISDVAPGMVAIAEARAAELALTNVSTRALDFEAIDEPDASFDVVLCREGLMFATDPARAVGEIHRVLRPGGRLSVIVYSTADRNAFFSIPVTIIRRIAGLPAPAPGLPGPFSLGGPGVLETAFGEAGFEDVAVRPLDAPVRFPTAGECVRFERESFGALHAMLAGVTPAQRDQAWQEIEAELGPFEGSGGFEGPCQLLIGSARRGA
jgi:SAM-dependent methyltransferase